VKINIHFVSYLADFFLELGMFRTKVVEIIKTDIFMFDNSFFGNSVFYEMIWKNTAEPGTSQLTIWRMLIACWMPKTTNIHSEYVTLLAFPLQQPPQEHASILCYTHI